MVDACGYLYFFGQILEIHNLFQTLPVYIYIYLALSPSLLVEICKLIIIS